VDPPIRGPQFADYATEKASEHEIWFTFGWPYETSACVTRLIFSGIYDELPNLKIITHHMGGMVPFYAGKIDLGFDQIFHGKTDENPVRERAGLKKRPAEYYRMLYADTSVNGSAAAARCGHAFFGTSHCLFATDAPFDAEQGRMLIRETINAVNALEIPAAERQRIFSATPAPCCGSTDAHAGHPRPPARRRDGRARRVSRTHTCPRDHRHHGDLGRERHHAAPRAGVRRGRIRVPGSGPVLGQEPGVELYDRNPEDVKKAFDLYYDSDYGWACATCRTSRRS